MKLVCPICSTQTDEAELKKLESDCHFGAIEGIDQHLVRHQCDRCEVIFGTQEMLSLPEEKLLQAYQDVYRAGYREADASRVEMELFAMLSPVKNGTYINWGSGTNSTHLKAKENDWTLLNYDPGIPNETPGYLTRDQLI